MELSEEIIDWIKDEYSGINPQDVEDFCNEHNVEIPEAISTIEHEQAGFMEKSTALIGGHPIIEVENPPTLDPS